MADADVAIVGGGVVGMACGAALASAGRKVVLLERHERPGLETSSHNSEVIHAGIYYPEGSLKARACVEGRELLYERCAREGIPHRRLGKLIVATSPDEEASLEAIRGQAERNGVVLEWLGARQVRELEPRVRAVAALHSPATGIVDSHALLSSYQAELEAHGGQVVLRTDVTGFERSGSSWQVVTTSAQGEHFRLDADRVVNAAGLAADRIAALAGVDVDAAGWRIHPCKGDYFAAAPSLGRLTERLVYPVPSSAGLGIHVTLDLGGRVRFGPDTEYVEAPSYQVDAAKAERFAAAVQRYLPEIEASHLQPEMAGVRPKLQEPGGEFRDFVLEESSARGVPGMVHLVGIESPGLTAAGALAVRVAQLV